MKPLLNDFQSSAVYLLLKLCFTVMSVLVMFSLYCAWCSVQSGLQYQSITVTASLRAIIATLLYSPLFSTFVSLCLYCSRESISRPVQHHLSDKYQDKMTLNLTTNMMISADYLVRVNEMKGRQNAVFESKSVRDQFESNARHNVSPG